ncbi:MAG TPA: hypothetical protein VF060_12735 [Trebonia sp.]
MPVVLLIVGLVVLIAVVYVARGRGGELSAERTDHAPLDLGPVSATDVALLRPPSAAWGYDMRTTDEALERIAESIRERDVRIVALEQLVTDLGRGAVQVPVGRPFPTAGHGRRAAEALTRADAPTRIDPPYGIEAPTTEHPTVVEPPVRAAAPIAPESLAAAPVPEHPEQTVPPPLPQRQPHRQQPPPERSHD